MTAYHYGFSPRKSRFLAQFIGQPVVKMSSIEALRHDDVVFVWGSADLPAVDVCPHVRVEDGFLRSVGLGAAFAEPLSWVFDRSGLHHQSDVPSDLEQLLQDCEYSQDTLDRAASLRASVTSAGLTKYNVGNRAWSPVAGMVDRRCHVVIGQVAGDAALESIRTPVRSNLTLLKSARMRYPDAFLIYKRHPDVSAGLRSGADRRAEAIADLVLDEVHLDAILPWVDAVHVMTSLAGFEALLRGKSVICHANPFYAGWGLTTDLHPLRRRQRRLSLDELTAAALIHYPRYRSAQTGLACEVEEVVAELAKGRAGLRMAAGAALGRVVRALGLTDRRVARPALGAQR